MLLISTDPRWEYRTKICSLCAAASWGSGGPPARGVMKADPKDGGTGRGGGDLALGAWIGAPVCTHPRPHLSRPPPLGPGGRRAGQLADLLVLHQQQLPLEVHQLERLPPLHLLPPSPPPPSAFGGVRVRGERGGGQSDTPFCGEVTPILGGPRPSNGEPSNMLESLYNYFSKGFNCQKTSDSTRRGSEASPRWSAVLPGQRGAIPCADREEAEDPNPRAEQNHGRRPTRTAGAGQSQGTGAGGLAAAEVDLHPLRAPGELRRGEGGMRGGTSETRGVVLPPAVTDFN